MQKLKTMDFTFDVTLKNRAIFKQFLETFTLEQLNKVPNGYSNNIFWNIAHTVVTQQLLVYKFSGLPMVVSDALVEAYKKGTKTERAVSQAEVDEIKDLLFSTIEKTEEDYKNGVFKSYQEYTVSTESTLKSAADAIVFNSFHEGIHLGYILALKKNI